MPLVKAVLHACLPGAALSLHPLLVCPHHCAVRALQTLAQGLSASVHHRCHKKNPDALFSAVAFAAGAARLCGEVASASAIASAAGAARRCGEDASASANVDPLWRAVLSCAATDARTGISLGILVFLLNIAARAAHPCGEGAAAAAAAVAARRKLAVSSYS